MGPVIHRRHATQTHRERDPARERYEPELNGPSSARNTMQIGCSHIVKHRVLCTIQCR